MHAGLLCALLALAVNAGSARPAPWGAPGRWLPRVAIACTAALLGTLALCLALEHAGAPPLHGLVGAACAALAAQATMPRQRAATAARAATPAQADAMTSWRTLALLALCALLPAFPDPLPDVAPPIDAAVLLRGLGGCAIVVVASAQASALRAAEGTAALPWMAALTLAWTGLAAWLVGGPTGELAGELAGGLAGQLAAAMP